MANEFNPYHVWLGIPPEEQPANAYRLLGIRLFETNGDVIDSAADRQMAHLRTFQGGKHGDLTQRLLNEVAAARVCLLDPKKRVPYDQQLRTKLAASPPAVPPTLPPAATPVPAASLRRTPAPVSEADQWNELLGNSTKPTHATGNKSAKSIGPAKQQVKKRQTTIYIAAAAMLVAAVGVGLLMMRGKSAGTLVFDWPASDWTDVTLSVDGSPVEAPASGLWEHDYPAGPHHILAQRPAYKFDADITLEAGQRASISPNWKPKATLILTWPLPDRNGARLTVDGRLQAVSHGDPLELPVNPGPHKIQITRIGGATFSTTANVEEDQRAIVSVVPVTQPPVEAKLVLDWPVSQRGGAAELTIDGQAVARSVADPFELSLKPGRHVVRISRAGFEPFRQLVDLSAGPNQPLTPIWTRLQKTAPTVVEAPVHVEPTTPQPAKKLPVPAVADQERIAKQLDELYKTSRSGPKDPDKAQELYDLAAKAGTPAAERYMLLLKGADMAATSANLSLALQGVDLLDADYEFDALTAKQKLLDKFTTAGKPDQVAVAIEPAEKLMDQAIAADRFEIALVLAASASRAASKSQIAIRKEVEEQLAHRRREIHLLGPIHAAAKKAQESLDKNPADPEANLIVGRWLCLYKYDWPAGLPLLAKGSDARLKSLAEHELKAPSDAEQQVALADDWWNLAQKEIGPARDSLHLHAGDIYQAAIPNLKSVLKKGALERRLAEIAKLPRPANAVAPKEIQSPTVAAATQAPSGSSHFPIGQWVDVLRMIDPARDRIAGNWKFDGAELHSADGQGNRIEIPVVVQGGYDLEIDFTRTKGDADVVAMLSIGGHSGMVTLSGFGGNASGLMNLSGQDANSPNNPTAVRPGTLENGHRYRMLISVRILADDQASFDLSLDGQPYLPHWEGNPSELGEHWYWEMANPSRLGLGSHCEVTFHSARLKMASGRALTAAEAAELLPPQSAPPTASVDQPSAPVAFAQNKWVNILPLVDTVRDRVEGRWYWDGNELSCKSAPFTRIGFPIDLEGSYDLEVEFTRAVGGGDVDAIVPVGSHGCVVSLSAYGGQVSGISDVNGRGAIDAANPATIRPGTLKNNQRHVFLVSIRSLADGRASVDVSLDGEHYLPHWEGDPAALSIPPWWALRNSKQPGIATYACKATFHSARLRLVSGAAALTAAAVESITASATAKAATPAVARPAPSATASDMPAAAAKFPRGQWIDVLGMVDPVKNAVQGTWLRNGTAISCSAEGVARLELPIAVNGNYELEVEFTRTAGDSDVDTIFAVGMHQCVVKLSADEGSASALESIDGRGAISPANPTAIRPGTIQNRRRHRLLVKVRAQGSDRASVDVLLNGKPYLPHWDGNLASFGMFRGLQFPNLREFGLAIRNDQVTFHAVRLRLTAGEAAPISAVPAVVKSDLAGGNGGGVFTDIGPNGSLLAGVRVVHDGVVNIVQPVFRTASGDVDGRSHGRNPGTSEEAIAKPGYAVGGMVVRTGRSVDGFKLIFMRMQGRQLDPSNSYESKWFGGRGGSGETKLGSDGRPVFGIYGASGTNLDSIGLVVEQTPAAASGKSP